MHFVFPDTPPFPEAYRNGFDLYKNAAACLSQAFLAFFFLETTTGIITAAATTTTAAAITSGFQFFGFWMLSGTFSWNSADFQAATFAAS